MVILVIMMTNKQNHDMNDNFQRNLERELREVEGRKYRKNIETLLHEWEDQGYGAEDLAVKFFGSYLGAIVIVLGLLVLLHVYGVIQFSFWFDIAVMLVMIGAFIILASFFASQGSPLQRKKGRNKND